MNHKYLNALAGLYAGEDTLVKHDHYLEDYTNDFLARYVQKQLYEEALGNLNSADRGDTGHLRLWALWHCGRHHTDGFTKAPAVTKIRFKNRQTPPEDSFQEIWKKKPIATSILKSHGPVG